MSKIRIGRSAVTGRFTTVSQAVRHPTTHIVQQIPHGDNDGKKK